MAAVRSTAGNTPESYLKIEEPEEESGAEESGEEEEEEEDDGELNLETDDLPAPPDNTLEVMRKALQKAETHLTKLAADESHDNDKAKKLEVDTKVYAADQPLSPHSDTYGSPVAVPNDDYFNLAAKTEKTAQSVTNLSDELDAIRIALAQTAETNKQLSELVTGLHKRVDKMEQQWDKVTANLNAFQTATINLIQDEASRKVAIPLGEKITTSANPPPPVVTHMSPEATQSDPSASIATSATPLVEIPRARKPIVFI